MQQLVQRLKACHKTLSSCESLTGGMFASSVVDVSGASAVFRGALVTYATELKIQLAQVRQESVSTYGVVSSEVAREMAVNTRVLLGSDIAVSFSGNAGPDVMEGKPAGLVYSAIAWDSGCQCFEDFLEGSRSEIRRQMVCLMTARLCDLLNRME